MRNSLKRVIALLLSVVLIISLAACGSGSSGENTPAKLKANETISDNTKWINSTIEGAIDSSLDISIKDDFYTSVNKDWSLVQSLEDDENCIDVFSECEDTLKERKLSFIEGSDTAVTPISNITEQALRHNQELVTVFANTAADWETRNRLDVEPLRPYIEAIESISTIEELTDYLTDIKGDNLTASSFLDLSVMSSYVDHDTYRLTVFPYQNFILHDSAFYKEMDSSGAFLMDIYAKEIISILTKLGYSHDEAKQVIRDCYKLEGCFVDHDETILSDEHSISSVQKGRTMDELINICGNYPVLKILQSRNMDTATEVHFCGDEFLAYLSSIYNYHYLPLFKACLIAQTVKSAADLLGREEYEITREIYGESKEKSETGTGSDGPVYEDEWDYILNDFVSKYLAGPMDILYVCKYSSDADKAQILSIIDDVINAFHTMIDSETWLSDAAKEASHQKLDMLSVRAVFPDKFEDYSDVVFEEGDTLVDMVKKTRIHEILDDSKLIDVKNDRSVWDLDDMPTTTINAYYMPSENSINILSGLLSSNLVFDKANPIETNLAGVGVIIGHEITHGFDDNGCNYDGYGANNCFWSLEDKNAFLLRTKALQNYYSSLFVYPGSIMMGGARVSGEAIADMGGMKLTLMVADSISGFDYDRYFKSFAEMWRLYSTFKYAEAVATRDEHPPAYFRVNVTVMQNDRFNETYGIKQGDGMYTAPDKRIAVW